LSAEETRSDVRDEFYARGFAVIRNAIDRRRVAWFLAHCLQPAATFWSARSITDADVTTMNSYYGTPQTSDFYNFCQHQGMITDRMLRFASDGTHNFFELLSEPIWSAISSLSAGPFAPSVFAHCRSIAADKSTPVCSPVSKPVSLHYDRLYHGDGNFIINVWCPLQDVGEAFGRPSLIFIPAPLHEIVPLLRNDGDVLKITDPRFKQFVAERESVAIELAAGDVATLHETYITPLMTEGRTSVEIRILGNSERFFRGLPKRVHACAT
jgi:hypothetical protein